MSKVSYKKGTKAQIAIRELLDTTGVNRNGSSSDYNFVRSLAEFGNSTGFITGGQMSILGRMYNRAFGAGKRCSWKRLGS